MTTITKSIIADNICQKFGFSKNFSDHVISSIFSEIVKIIIEDSKINLPNLGSFQIHKKNARPGMNMQKMEKIIIASRKIIRFIPSRNIKEQVNGTSKILHNK
jgi:integration host factor subunit alpha